MMFINNYKNKQGHVTIQKIGKTKMMMMMTATTVAQ